MQKECPMCAEAMRLSVREQTVHIPGQTRPTSSVVREWICPECDYFEEAEEGVGET